VKWNLTADQKALTAIIARLRMRVISNEEFAVEITEAGFARERIMDEDGTSGENISNEKIAEIAEKPSEI
jgi:hypothetical protein